MTLSVRSDSSRSSSVGYLRSRYQPVLVPGLSAIQSCNTSVLAVRLRLPLVGNERPAIRISLSLQVTSAPLADHALTRVPYTLT